MSEVLLGLLLIAWEWAVSHWRFLVALVLAVQGLKLLSRILRAVSVVATLVAQTQREIERLSERMEIRVGDSLDRIEGKLQDAEYRQSLQDDEGN